MAELGTGLAFSDYVYTISGCPVSGALSMLFGWLVSVKYQLLARELDTNTPARPIITFSQLQCDNVPQLRLTEGIL